jgi:hypothetical protein
MRALGQNAFDHAELLTVLPQVWQSGPKMRFSFGHTLFESGQLSLDERGVGAKRGQFRRVALIQNMREGSLFTRPGEENRALPELLWNPPGRSLLRIRARRDHRRRVYRCHAIRAIQNPDNHRTLRV